AAERAGVVDHAVADIDLLAIFDRDRDAAGRARHVERATAGDEEDEGDAPHGLGVTRRATPQQASVLAMLRRMTPVIDVVVPARVEPIADKGVELVLGVQAGRRGVAEKVATALIDTVYRHRWSGVGPVRALKFPALVALGMRDRGAGWDVEMLVRAVKLGLSC